MTQEIQIGDKTYFIEDKQKFHIENGFAGVVNLDDEGNITGWAYGKDLNPDDPKSVEAYQEFMVRVAKLLPAHIDGSFIVGLRRE